MICEVEFVKKAYLIDNIEEYGKIISYCIENDISVFVRTGMIVKKVIGVML